MGEECIAEKVYRNAGCMTSVGINRLYFRGTSRRNKWDIIIVLDYVNSIDKKLL